MNIDIPFSPRLNLLWEQSHLEAGTAETDIPEHKNQPTICLYPTSFVDNVEEIGFKKSRDFNFRGAVYIDRRTQQARQWLLSFSKRNFTSRSYFQVTDKKAKLRRLRTLYLLKNHRLLGDFDYTFREPGFVPKESPVAQRGYFDEKFFRIMCESEFTLCPAGDSPWSMRFYEAILCKSIPILEVAAHTGRNKIEYNIGYKYYLATDTDRQYRQDWADENYDRFIKYQTLLP